MRVRSVSTGERAEQFVARVARWLDITPEAAAQLSLRCVAELALVKTFPRESPRELVEVMSEAEPASERVA